MIFNPPKYLLPLIISALCLCACSNGQDDQAIGESYLNSERYQQFERQSVKERSGKSDEATAFEGILSSLLTDPATKELNPPVQIDSLSVDKYLDASAACELKLSMLNEPARMDYTYYPVAKTERDGLNLLFFLIQKSSVYRDIELAVATFNDTTLIRARSLAEFKKTISMRVGSKVQVGRSLDIISEIKREPFYPVPQEYHTIYRYTIDEKGEIEEEILSEGK